MAPVAVVIVNHDRRELLCACLASLGDAARERPLVIVVDNASSDGSPEAARAAWPGADVLELPHNSGFAHANNVGIAHALRQGAHGVLVLNNDTRLAPGALDAMTSAIDREARVGMVAARVVMAHDERTLDGTGQRITRDGFGKLEQSGRDTSEAEAPRETFCPYGAAAYFDADLLREVAPDGEWFDEDFRLYCEELDLGWRARLLGWTCVYAPQAIVFHHRGATSGQYSELLAWYTSRNTIWNVVKNYPRWYAWRAFLLTPLRPLVLAIALVLGRGPAAKFGARIPAWRLPLVLLRGWAAAVVGMPTMLRKRKRVQGRRVVGDEEVSRWFAELGEPFLAGLLR